MRYFLDFTDSAQQSAGHIGHSGHGVPSTQQGQMPARQSGQAHWEQSSQQPDFASQHSLTALQQPEASVEAVASQADFGQPENGQLQFEEKPHAPTEAANNTVAAKDFMII